MRVGVYIDGFNLYYGGRSLFGKGTSCWKWLDLQKLGERLLSTRSQWSAASLERVVFCTARIEQVSNQSAYVDQDIYLRALAASGSIDTVELGYYVTRIKQGALARKTRGTSFEHIDMRGAQILRGRPPVIVSVAIREEKGSDVNVAAHLLHDALTHAIDAAIVISNDSDLAFALRTARQYVPVGTVNPSPNYLAGALKGRPSDGVGNHWWTQLNNDDFRNCQLSDPVPDGGSLLRKPSGC